ncbi:MAG TPA: DNA topoisomerase (ATP-hydrolyzing), partial [Candidatus Dormibacteraeota bacterium]|nr:DNA topoisomerase (ATP-hydrolyzing) [Candidatus Dormibacteraeota bacterium]
MTLYEPGTIQPIELELEMRQSYMDYAMSVIISRALPEVRDGLKPAQRRILWAMLDQGMTAGARYKKSAAIVGEVIKNYHPHGDAPVYDTLVRLAQDWVMRYPLVDGQGNFGSVDGDPPAHQRYTEARMTAVAMSLVEDIEKETVDFGPNYSNDPDVREPLVLPALLPNLLVNGASGIAVGMATNIPPHNLGEICDAAMRLIDDPEATTDDLIRIVKGPDFPTGGIIYTRDIATVYGTGHGRIVVRAQVDFEESKSGREQIVVRELPYQVNKARLQQTIAELVDARKLEGIADMRDESGRDQKTRLVIELKPNARPFTVLNNLYKHTQLQTTFGALMLAIVDGRPQVLGLKPLLQHYIDHRRDVVTRRTRHELERAKDRAHILEGLIKCLDHIDEVIAIIRGASDERAAQKALEERFELTERQSKAIVDLRLGRLTRLESGKLREEYEELIKLIARLEDILANPRLIDGIVKDEITGLRKRFADPRRTEIRHDEVEMNEEDLIPKEQVFVTLTHRGYIKRMPLDTYRAQHRGGKGIVGARRSTDED